MKAKIGVKDEVEEVDEYGDGDLLILILVNEDVFNCY